MNGNNILIVEDDVPFSVLLSEKLKQRLPQYHQHFAYSSRDCQQSLSSKTSFALITLDMKLPDDADGIFTLRFCREKSPHSIIMIVTGGLNMYQINSLHSMGASYVVQKDTLLAHLHLDPVLTMMAVQLASFSRGQVQNKRSWITTGFGAAILILAAYRIVYEKDIVAGLTWCLAGLGLMGAADAKVVNTLAKFSK